MTGDYDYKYFVGWCPDCDSVTVERIFDGQEVPTCGCGKRLQDVTACKDMREVGAVIERDMEMNGKSRENVSTRRKSEHWAKGGDKIEFSRATVDALHDLGLEALFSMALACIGCDGDCGCCPEEDELGRGELYGFSLVPSPFMVYVRGEGYDDAVDTLRDGLDDFALAGFKTAMEEGNLGFHVIPVDGKVTYRAEQVSE